jgi:RHS repeat-associated protein
MYQLDAPGSVRVVTNQAGQEVTRHDFLPFGEEFPTPMTPSMGKLFTGKERDAETGLDYFGARYYDSGVGRFTTIDPIYTWKENLVDPQRWNRYAYVRNNPLRYIDPDGRDIAISAATSKSDASFLRNALVEYVRREGGRAQFEKLAGDKTHTVVLTAGTLNDAARLQMALTLKEPTPVAFGKTDPEGNTATVTLDRSVHTGVWATPAGVDTVGVVTVGHELEHVDAWASGDMKRWSEGDKPTSATGPAMKTGQRIEAQQRTLSKKEAEAIVDAALKIKK